MCLPVVVDLPESTWPITTTLMCIFSLLHYDEMSVRCSSRCDRMLYHRRDDRKMRLMMFFDSPHDCGIGM
jgi:hypothetical protein